MLNILWIVLGGGLVLWLEYVLVGLVLCLTIIGIPFGVQCFKIAGLALLPFGKDIDARPAADGALRVIGNVLWFVFAGLWIFLTHLALAVGAGGHHHRHPVRRPALQAGAAGRVAVRSGAAVK